MNKGRGYMFKPDQHFLLRLWAYFFARTFPHRAWGEALCSCGAFHIVWRCKRQNTAVRLPRVFLPFVVDHMYVVADEEVRAAFFVPYRQPYPTDSGIRLQHT